MKGLIKKSFALTDNGASDLIKIKYCFICEIYCKYVTCNGFNGFFRSNTFVE